MPHINVLIVSVIFGGAFLLLGYLSIYVLKMKPRSLRYFKFRTRRK